MEKDNTSKLPETVGVLPKIHHCMDDIYHAKEVVGEMGSDIYMYDVNNYKISI